MNWGHSSRHPSKKSSKSDPGSTGPSSHHLPSADDQQGGLKVQIRWLIRRDMPEVLGIEESSFAAPWSEEDFLGYLRQRNCIGMVAEYNQQIVGFMIYELHKARLQVLNFACSANHRRLGIGSQMVDKLVDKLSQQRRQEILLEVRESNLEAQLFFKKLQFRAVRVLRRHFDDTIEDAYVMRYRLFESESADDQHLPHKRISFFDAA